METNVPMILAMKRPDASTINTIAMIRTNALTISVINKLDAIMKLSFAMITLV
jgi:hypothetical protein